MFVHSYVFSSYTPIHELYALLVSSWQSDRPTFNVIDSPVSYTAYVCGQELQKFSIARVSFLEELLWPYKFTSLFNVHLKLVYGDLSRDQIHNCHLFRQVVLMYVRTYGCTVLSVETIQGTKRLWSL